MIVIDSKCKRFTYDYIVWNVPITEKTYQVFQYHYSSQKKSSRLTNPHWNGCTTSHFNVKVNEILMSKLLSSIEKFVY